MNTEYPVHPDEQYSPKIISMSLFLCAFLPVVQRKTKFVPVINANVQIQLQVLLLSWKKAISPVFFHDKL